MENTVALRAKALFDDALDRLRRKTDRMFAWLMGIQWVAGIAAALIISPNTWIGAEHKVSIHVWAAIFLGGVISAFPIFLALTLPGRPFTRQVIAVAQMLTSALLIHLTGGRIETHFHVFASLAFLAFYRDWKVLATATAIVAVDHLVRGIYWPQSVFGVMVSSPWRWTEHAAWVLFEDVGLFISINQSLKEMSDVATRQAELEEANEDLEQKRAAEATHEQHLQLSRQAGMAEVATGVLHNVGNVLNSVSVAATVVCNRLRKSEIGDVHRAAKILLEKNGQLGQFLESDPRGKLLPEFLAKASGVLATEREELIKEMALVGEHIEHIKEIVAMQQTYAKVFGVMEPVSPASLVQDALKMNLAAFDRHGVKISNQVGHDAPTVMVDRHKVLQILTNLFRNAKYAMDEQNPAEKRLEIQADKTAEGQVAISVRDNGVGISAENLTRIFGHGFTTKKDGHGFGLHSGALAAKQMNGSLTVQSDGPGKGAVFTLTVPTAEKRNPAAPVSEAA